MQFNFEPTVTVVRKNYGNGLLPQECQCCRSSLSNRQPLELMECCRADPPKVAHQACLKQALQPKTITTTRPNAEGALVVSTVVQPAHCPGCGSHLPLHSAISSSTVSVLEAMDASLAQQLKSHLSLKEMVELINDGWRQINFVARYGHGLADEHVLTLLRGESLLNGGSKRIAILHDLVEYHSVAIFQYVLGQCRGNESWKLISQEEILKPLRKNPSSARLTQLLIEKLFKDNVCMDPVKTEGKLIWKAFVKDSMQKEALLASLARSRLIEHQLALAHAFRDGIIGDFNNYLLADVAQACQFYWQVIVSIMSLESFMADQLSVLGEACHYLVAHFDKGNIAEKTVFIQAVHILASHRHNVDQLLPFIYKDFLHSLNVKDFLHAYTALQQRGMRISCQTSDGATPLHLVARYWPAAGMSCQAIKTIMQALIGNDVNINAQDKKGETPLHHLCQYLCESKVLTSSQRLELLQWLANNNATVVNIANKAGKTPLQYVCEIWLQAGMDQNHVVSAVHALAPKTDLKQHSIILRIIAKEWATHKMDGQKLVEMVVYLVRAGADANYGADKYKPVLHLVTLHWLKMNINIQLIWFAVKQLIDAGADINARDDTLNTLLNHVCLNWSGSPDQILSDIDQLKQWGAKIDIANKLGDLPIHSLFVAWPKIATLAHIKAALRALVPANAIDSANLAGETLLHKVCGHWVQQPGVKFELIEAVLTLLFAQGANAYVQNKNLDTPLHLVCQLGQLSNGEAMILSRMLLNQAPAMINVGNSTKTTPLHLFARGWMKNVSKDVFDNDSIMAFFKEFLQHGADVNALDHEFTTPVHDFAHHWVQQGATYQRIFDVFTELKNRGANLDAISNRYHNVVMIVARHWVSYYGADQTLQAFMQLEELGFNLRCMDLAGRDGITPFLAVAKFWLQQGASYTAMHKTLQWMVTRKATPDQKDAEGKNLLLYFVEDWVPRIKGDLMVVLNDLFELSPHLDVNAIDPNAKTFLHLLFEKWGNTLNPLQLWNMVELMQMRRANFNLPDKSGATAVFNLFTHWNQINHDDYFDGMLKRFEECGANFGVENKQGVTILHLAARRASYLIFAYVLEKFPSAERVIAFAGAPKFESSLLGCLLADTPHVDEKFNRLSYYLITANVPLELENVMAQHFWRHLQKLNRIAEFDRDVSANASPEQVIAVARYYRDTAVVKKVADLPLAHAAYEATMRKLFTGETYLFRAEYFGFIDEIKAFGKNIIKRNDFITDAERAALGMLFGDQTHKQDVVKALSELEKLSKKFLLRSASMFACIVLARHYETGLMLPIADAKRALSCYILANDMESPAGELNKFINFCRQSAIDGIERLSEEQKEASEYLVGYFAKQQRLDLAQAWYAKMLNKTPKVKAMMGKLCVDLNQADVAIELYHYIPALMSRADACCNTKQFTPAIKDYCRVLLLARDDPKTQKLAVDALLKMREAILNDKSCGVAIVDVMINVIDRAHYDRGMVDKLLSAFAMERLFSATACQKPKHVPSLFKPLNKVIEANQRVYTTRYASVYLHIMSDALYEFFKQRLAEGDKKEVVVELLNAISAADSPLPEYLLNAKFNERIAELKGVLRLGSIGNSNN